MSDTPHSDKSPEAPVDLGLFAKGISPARITAAEIIAIALSLLWLAGCGVFFLVMGGETTLSADGESVDPPKLVIALIAVFMPVAIIWVAAAATRSARVMREESERLQTAIDAMRHTYLQQQQSGGLARGAASVERKLDQIAQAQKQTESAIATFTSIRPSSAGEAMTQPTATVQTGTDEQPALALGTTAEEMSPPLSTPDFIRAMHFPENPDDQEGFRALRRALQDHHVSVLVRAAQDVLTLLSQDGIYMDDLRPDLARPEFWRKFAEGERGRAIAPLGGIRDRSSLALTAGRMRKDPVFRDAAHHFLRKFDQVYSTFAKGASDQDIANMAETRTARAFMLLGRVTGTFD